MNSLIIQNNKNLEHPFKMEALVDGLIRAEKETVIRDHIQALRQTDAQYKAQRLNDKALALQKAEEADARAKKIKMLKPKQTVS